MTTQENTAFLLIQCDCGCGRVMKKDISKFTKRVQRGLQKDYGIRAAQKPGLIGPHNCRDCGKRCKADNGEGTQKAAELIEIVGRRREILQALASYDRPATLKEINLWLNVTYEIQTTEKATGSRVSELLYWKLVEQVSLDGPTSAGDIYPDTNTGAFVLNKPRVELLEKYSWQTWILTAIDNGLSWKIDDFSQPQK